MTLKRKFLDIYDGILNKIWFCFNVKEYKCFIKRLERAEIDKKERDIWYSRQLGFICFPKYKPYPLLEEMRQDESYKR